MSKIMGNHLLEDYEMIQIQACSKNNWEMKKQLWKVLEAVKWNTILEFLWILKIGINGILTN